MFSQLLLASCSTVPRLGPFEFCVGLPLSWCVRYPRLASFLTVFPVPVITPSFLTLCVIVIQHLAFT